MKSRLIQLTDYLLLEYQYSYKNLSTEVTSLIVEDNKYFKYKRVTNDDSSLSLIGNVRDNSAIQISDKKYVFSDIDIPVPYFNKDNNIEDISLSDLTDIEWEVTYDNIKLHLLSGYTFPDKNGFIFETLLKQKNSDTRTYLSQYVFEKSDNIINFNTKPIYINGRVYDRYIDISIVSPNWLISSQESNPNLDEEIAYYITYNNAGIDKNSLIEFKVQEISNTEKNNGYVYFTVDSLYETTLELYDNFDTLSCVIEEKDGYFEYYPTWNDGFIDDLITTLNGAIDDYVVFHDLVISEQVGFDERVTDNFTFLQSGDFTSPKIFRPVLKYADVAYSFSIDYYMRFTDTVNGKQIVRRASITSTNCKTYGKNFKKLNINVDSPQKIVKKNGDIVEYVLNYQNEKSPITKVVIPTYINRNNLSVTTTKLFFENNELKPSGLSSWDIVFGQNDGYIFLTPFDNYYEISLFDVNQVNNTTSRLALDSEQSIFLIIESNGIKYRYSKFTYDATDLRIIFKIPSKDSEKILFGGEGLFYITSGTKSKLRCNVNRYISDDIKGKEVIIDYDEYYSKTDDSYITVTYNKIDYQILKRNLEIVEFIPGGLTNDETVIYTGKWSSMEKYSMMENYVKSLQQNSLSTQLGKLQSLKKDIEQSQQELNSLKSELDAREKKLLTVENSLTSREATLKNLQQQLDSQKDFLNKESSILTEEKNKLQKSLDDAKNNDSTIKNLTDAINKLKEQINQNQKNNNNTTNNNNNNNNNNGGTKGKKDLNINEVAYNPNFDLSYIISKNIKPDWVNSNIGLGENTTENNNSNTNNDTSLCLVEYRNFYTKDYTVSVPNRILSTDKTKVIQTFDLMKNFQQDSRISSGYKESQVSFKTMSVNKAKLENITWSKNSPINSDSVYNINTNFISWNDSVVGNNNNVNKKNINVFVIKVPKYYPNLTLNDKTLESYYKQSYQFELPKDEFYQNGKNDDTNNKNTAARCYYLFIEKYKISEKQKEITYSYVESSTVSGSTYKYDNLSLPSFDKYNMFSLLFKNYNIDSLCSNFQALMNDPISNIQQFGHKYIESIANIAYNENTKNVTERIDYVMRKVDTTQKKNTKSDSFIKLRNKSGIVSYLYGQLAVKYVLDNSTFYSQAEKTQLVNNNEIKTYPDLAQDVKNGYTYNLLDYYQLTDYVYDLPVGTTKKIYI